MTTCSYQTTFSCSVHRLPAEPSSITAKNHMLSTNIKIHIKIHIGWEKVYLSYREFMSISGMPLQSIDQISAKLGKRYPLSCCRDKSGTMYLQSASYSTMWIDTSNYNFIQKEFFLYMWFCFIQRNLSNLFTLTPFSGVCFVHGSIKFISWKILVFVINSELYPEKLFCIGNSDFRYR